MESPSGSQQVSDAARLGAAVVLHADFGTLAVRGRDRATWLQGLLTCDVVGLRAGEAAWGLALNKQGKVLADFLLGATPDALLLGLPRARATVLADHLEALLVMEDAELVDESSEHAWLEVVGPRAGDLARAASPPEGLVAALDRTGLGGAIVVTPARSVEASTGSLARKGAALAGPRDWEALRIERRLPRWGRDMDDSTLPHEARLERAAVRWSKGCYLGQEVICMQEMRGKVRRRLELLRLEGGEGSAPLELPADVTVSEDFVGRVTSAVWSTRAGGMLGLAILPARVDDAALTVAGRRAHRLAEPV